MATTIRDVAEAAGVSPMAVSKVLHGKGANVRVSAETAENIRRVARELRYRPNHLARSLRSRRTHTIALVFERFERLDGYSGYFVELLNGVMRALFPAEYTFAVCPKLINSSSEGSFDDGRFDGVLWCKPNFDADIMSQIRHSTVPVVMVHTPADTVPGVPTFCVDNDAALRLAVNHLADLGHRRVAFVIDEHNQASVEGVARVHAFQDASRARFGRPGDVLTWSHECTELAAYRGSSFRHTGLITFSEFLASRVLERAMALGIAVPGDLSVIGFDSSSLCEGTKPRLTAISQPVEQMAFEACRRLIAIVEGVTTNAPLATVYDCGLDVRESTARPSA